ncbi:MAG: hypothetical protein IJU71_07960 [Selenomonadaceae bacterium]|nr:hypothetical protein [Selenomonadaceae bacterium]
MKNTLQQLNLTTEINSRALNSIDEQLALLGLKLSSGNDELRREVSELRSTVDALVGEVGAINELLRLLAANQLLSMVDPSTSHAETAAEDKGSRKRR